MLNSLMMEDVHVMLNSLMMETLLLILKKLRIQLGFEHTCAPARFGSLCVIYSSWLLFAREINFLTGYVNIIKSSLTPRIL